MMNKEIQKLFDDLNLFARQIAKVRLSNLSFDVYEFKDRHVKQVDLIFARKNQFDTIQEAFSALFKKELFDGEEWDIIDEPDPSDKKWLTALKDFWINAYYSRVCNSLELLNKNDFISRFKRDLADVNVPEQVIKELLIRLNHIETIQVQKGYVYDYIFGQSDSHYFLFEWGIYD